jgi:ABC-type sugar transport system permease subunit
VFVTTNGGPANQTTVPGLLVYRLAFNEGTIGAASALAVVLSLIVIAAVTIIRAVAKDRS